MFYIKQNITQMYDLPDDPAAIARKVDYLLEPDRFMCPPRGYEVSLLLCLGLASGLTTDWTQSITFRFLAPQIADAIYGKYYDGVRMQGILDPGFLKRINATMICLTCAMLCHALRAWQTGLYKRPSDFKPELVGGMSLRILAC